MLNQRRKNLRWKALGYGALSIGIMGLTRRPCMYYFKSRRVLQCDKKDLKEAYMCCEGHFLISMGTFIWSTKNALQAAITYYGACEDEN